MHHGKGFLDEIGRVAAVGARTLFEFRDEVDRRWPELADRSGSAAAMPVAAIVGAKPRWS
jgi:hypothetical protein